MSDTLLSLLDRSRFSPKVQINGDVVIYGAGMMGRKVLTTLLKQGITPRAFVDEYTNRSHVEGVPVCRLADSGQIIDCSVIVALFNRERNARFEDVRKLIQKAGFSSVISFEQYYLRTPELLREPLFWLANTDYLYKNVEELMAVDNLLADVRSRNIFRAQIQYRLTGDSEWLPEAEPDQQYVPCDVPLLPQPYRFIDIGAFDGDTLAALKAHHVLLESVMAFEPDMRNFKALVERVKTQGPLCDRSDGVVSLWRWPILQHRRFF